MRRSTRLCSTCCSRRSQKVDLTLRLALDLCLRGSHSGSTPGINLLEPLRRTLSSTSSTVPLSLDATDLPIESISSPISRADFLQVARKLALPSGSFSSWYTLRPEDLAHFNRGGEINKSKSWIHNQLLYAFPEHSWEKAKFQKFLELDRGRSLEALRDALVEIGKDLGVNEGEFEKWYKVPNKDIIKKGGRPLLARFENSKWRMLATLFSEHRWDLNSFPKKPDRHWKSTETRLETIKRISSKLGIRDGDYEAWYRVRSRDVSAAGGSALILQYKNSISHLVSTLFPEHGWDLGKFSKKPNRYWDSLPLQRAFLSTLGEKLGIKPGDFEAWYKVTGQDVKKQGGEVLLNKKYNSSISKMLMAVFPEHKWDESRFSTKPREYWSSTERQREFLLDLGDKLGYKRGNLDAWYGVSRDDFIKHGGSVILELYGGPRPLLTSVFSEHSWLPWKFSHFQGQWFWKDEEARNLVVQFVERSLNMKDLDSWRQVSMKELKKLGLGGILRTEASLAKLLGLVYPDRTWN